MKLHVWINLSKISQWSLYIVLICTESFCNKFRIIMPSPSCLFLKTLLVFFYLVFKNYEFGWLNMNKKFNCIPNSSDFPLLILNQTQSTADFFTRYLFICLRFLAFVKLKSLINWCCLRTAHHQPVHNTTPWSSLTTLYQMLRISL